YARESWYIKMTEVKDQLIRNNNTVKWYPESIGKGRFGDWLENVQDWAVSRNRYWGTPLNIWECECGHRHAIGSIAELRELSSNCPEDIELHRPYVDQVTIPCPHCGKEMHRVPEVIDCWFDSGSMPFAQHHYPFENKELFESQFPADFISEAVDQTRGWFYSLLAISTLLFDKAPFKNVLVQGLVQDENGQKMSKSKGNAVDPMEALKKFGADPLRWYFYTNSAPWLPSRFHEKAVIEGQKKFFSTLWNTYAFYVLYANIDSFDPTQYQLDQCALTVMDRWLLSRLNTAVQAVDENLSAYKVPEACRALQDFVDEMSNWYVRRSRERYWAQGVTDDKTAAYMTLYTALVTTAKMAAPMAPFMSEDIYRNLVCSVDKAAPESVHLCAWPQYEAARVDKKLEADMDEVLRIVTQGRAARNLCGRKNRQPLQALYTDADAGLGELYQDIIKQELNVKELHFLSDMSQFTDYTFKPQLKLLGKKLGKRLGEVRQALSELDGSAAKKELDDTGVLKLALPDGEVDLTAEELLIDTAQKEGFTSISDRGLTVVLDTTLNDQLIEEGFVREIVSKLQSMRKDAGFNVVDHIEVYHQGSQKIAQVLRDNQQSILSDVLGEACHHDQLDGYTAQWDINGETTTFGVKKL
ncbi:MAG TPA: class I tRNA ligase family protein, partial [Candidatus Acutalibacter pullistercoris]|nr:class I tRNA ligase family protein [Candidatus Acutalibacter pullistercoris]